MLLDRIRQWVSHCYDAGTFCVPRGNHTNAALGGAVDLEYPQWQEPLAAAILEFNRQQLREKLKCAEEAINIRIQELRLAENSEHELRSLFDGLSIIRGLRLDRLDSPSRET